MGDNILPSRTPLEAVKQEEVSFPHYFADFLLIIPEHIYVFSCLYFDYSLSLTAYTVLCILHLLFTMRFFHVQYLHYKSEE